jgi:hypothetical protein
MNKALLFLSLCFCLFAEKTEILFHLHDAGETNALLPVIRQLETDYLIVTSGVSEKLLVGIPPERLRSFQQYSLIEPNEVVTGVASELQGEVLDFFRNKGVLTFAFWDNFNADGESPYFKTAHGVEPRADILLLPCESLVEAFPNRLVRVVGHPTLDPKVLNKIALWVGGYGKDYEEAYELFLKGMAGVEGVTVIVQHHPKTGRKNDLKIDEALSLADLVICHQSTASFQALAANKPVLHVIPVGQHFDSLPLQKGLAKKVSAVEDFPQAVKDTLESDVSGFFELMGIPQNSTESCKAALLEGITIHSLENFR